MTSDAVGAVTGEVKAAQGLVPKLRFPEFRGAKDWNEKAGCALFGQITDRNKNSNLPVLAVTQEQGAIPRSLIDYHVSVTDKSIESYKVVSVGDFIISLRSFQGGIEYARYEGLCSPAYVVLRLRDQNVPDYFRHYLKTDRFIKILTKNLEGLRDGKMISYAQFSELTFPVPRVEEQKRIAACLSSLDELIAAEGERLAALRGYKKGLMQRLFPRPERIENGEKIPAETIPRLRFPEFLNAGDWEERPLGDLLECPPAYGVNAAAVPYDELLPTYLRITDISEDGRFIDADKTSVNVVATESNSMQPNDIALTRTGASVGKAYLHTEANGPLIFAGFLIRVRPDQRRALSQIVFQYMQTQAYRSWVLKTSARSGQPGLNSAEYSVLRVPLPPDGPDGLSEQRQIANCLSAIDGLAVALTDRIAALKAHKTALIQQLFPSPPEMSA